MRRISQKNQTVNPKARIGLEILKNLLLTLERGNLSKGNGKSWNFKS